jgi:hypothetical protein
MEFCKKVCSLHNAAKMEIFHFFWLHNFLQNNIKTYVYLDKMEINSNEKNEKKRGIYSCEKCNFICSYKSDFDRHCATRRHKMEIMEINGNKDNESHQISSYNCANCGKKYATNAGLWKHSKVCKPIKKENTCIIPLDDVANNLPIQNYVLKLIEQNMLLVEQNQDFKHTLLEQSNKMVEQNDKIIELAKNQNTTINTTNIQNNHFNLTVFLQERCKDALNMSQFIDTLQINPQSVEYTGAHGYVNGITKIFMDGLNQLDIHERPIHCTDLKRETLYIKENDKWEKDTEDKTRFKHALATVVNRNVAQVSHWEKENPRCHIPETDEYEFYFDIVRQSLGGGNHDVTARNNDKILRAIAGKVYLDKKTKEIQ